MNKPALPRIGAACGAVFAIVLTVAAGNGDQSFSGPRAVAGIAAITLALPFGPVRVAQAQAVASA